MRTAELPPRLHVRARFVERALRRDPQAAAPTLERKKSSVPSAICMPSPSSPSRCAAGTRQPSSRSSAIGCGAIISCLRPIVSPGWPASMTKALIARFAASDVRAKTTKNDAIVALEMKTLLPSST